MKKTDKTYLMVAGTLLPAFAGVAIVNLFSKDGITAKSAKYLITFGALSIVGGWFSAQVIKRAETPTIVTNTVEVKVPVQPTTVPLTSFNQPLG